MTQLDNGDAAVWFSHNHYQYNNVGREVARWREEGGNKGEQFWFNPANEITRAVYQADNVWTGNASNWNRFRDYNYAPDLLNWTSVNDNGYLAPLAHNDLNQYTGINGFAPSYDGNFNQTTSYYGQTFVYNAQNQLVDGGSMRATYDGLGRCVRRTVGGNTLLFTYDGWNPIYEWDQSGNWVALNIYGPRADEILGRYDAVRGPLVYKHDNQGSVTFILDGPTHVAEKYTYDVYGRPTIMDGAGNVRGQTAMGNRFMFTGREWIAELQLYDYRHRFYNPDTGRFLQADSKGFDAGDMNLFRYVGDDPVDKTDPTGLTQPSLALYGQSVVPPKEIFERRIIASQVASFHLGSLIPNRVTLELIKTGDRNIHVDRIREHGRTGEITERIGWTDPSLIFHNPVEESARTFRVTAEMHIDVYYADGAKQAAKDWAFPREPMHAAAFDHWFDSSQRIIGALNGLGFASPAAGKNALEKSGLQGKFMDTWRETKKLDLPWYFGGTCEHCYPGQAF